MSHVLYVLGPEGAGKTDLINQLVQLCNDKLFIHPRKYPATTGQQMLTLELEPNCSVEVREVGGSMVNSWEKFIKSKISGPDSGAVKYGLLYVISGAAPHQLPLSLSAFQLLKGNGGVCAEWPTQVVIQKAGIPHAMSVTEVKQLMIDGARLKHTSIVEADSWNGIGLGNVHEWLLRVFVL